MRSKKKNTRRGDGSDNEDEKQQPSEGGNGFVFVDRTGKVHTRRGGPSHPEPRADKPLRSLKIKRNDEQPTPDKRDAHSTRPSKGRKQNDIPDAGPFSRPSRPLKSGKYPPKGFKPGPTPTGPSIRLGESSKRDRPEREDRSYGKRGLRGQGRDHGQWGKNRNEQSQKWTRSEHRNAAKLRRVEKRGGDLDKPHAGRGAERKANARTAQAAKTLKGRIDKNRKGFGFVIFADREIEDMFVPPREAEGLFHGDRVEVSMGKRGEVLGIRVLEHRFRELVGKYQPHPAGSEERGGVVVYERKKAREEVFIPPGEHGGATAGDWIRAKVNFHEDGPFHVTAEISEIYGKELPASADIRMVADEYNLIEEHSKEAVREAESFTLDMNDPHRQDLREIPFITIDGETARDFDDAVYVERSKGGYVLWVAIADVSHYVKSGTKLDDEARSRGTSVYFPERAFHMLPRALSENLCSLKPKEPRLAMVARMEYDANGTRRRTEILEGLIESKRRATYTEIQTEWEANQGNKNWEYAPHFELFKQIKRQRSGRGSIDFELPEAYVEVDKQGEVISITNRKRVDAHMLIEDFMIAANEAVTEWALEREWPFVYRVHEEPAEDSIYKFQKLAANAGVKMKLSGSGANLPQILADVVRQLEGNPAQTMLNMALLRSMKQAVYTAAHGIHFGLASEGYTHFTSPIRRYPDLVVHRMLRHALRVEKKIEKTPSKNWFDETLKELEEICEHCSYRERIASDAEREAIKLKQVRAIIPKLGEEFDGKIIGIVESGFFVEVNDPYVEGMVSVESLHDDYYQFSEERMEMVGKRTRRAFRIGDLLRVRAAKADIDSRRIDFVLVEPEGAPAGNKHPDRRGRPFVRPEDIAAGLRNEQLGGPRNDNGSGPGSGGRGARRKRRFEREHGASDASPGTKHGKPGSKGRRQKKR